MTFYQKNQQAKEQLRNQYAGLAMQAYLSCGTDSPGIVCLFLKIDQSIYKYNEHYPIYIAKRAVAFADALINELQEPQL